MHTNENCSTTNIPLSSVVSIISSSSRRYSSNSCTNVRHEELQQTPPVRKPRPNIENLINAISFRARMRKFLNTRLTFVSNIMSFLGILGIFLMIIENELHFDWVNHGDIGPIWFMKLIISITTAILLGLILYYHYLDLQLYSIQNSLDDYRVGLTRKKICFIASELLICAIHPMPLSSLNSNLKDISPETTVHPSLSYTSVEVALSLPMFLRLYLFGRTIMFHSYLFRDGSLRSISCLNQVSIDLSFLLKTYLEQWATRCLLALNIIAFLIGSWCLRACDYTATGDHLSIFDSMWLFIVTFTTVGFGDVYPSTLCGRGITTVVGFIGLLSSALFIAVLTQKLHLTREEKYVHTFVSKMQLAKDRENQAANVVKFAMKVWYLKRQNKRTFIQSFHAQRKLFRAISSLQQTKRQQGYLMDSCIGLHEIIIMQHNLTAQHDETLQQMEQMKNDIRKIQTESGHILEIMKNIQTTLNTRLNQSTI
ncbi:unnamed protein product [Adineta ricciae]|uniref:Calmodulin-binding domain-containing protein n=2 Tax=Adineta ricciae TaxID=249248 RepID=A0A814PJ09_ADIRI|nr:unnamed protein product [Adineta ricciae]